MFIYKLTGCGFESHCCHFIIKILVFSILGWHFKDCTTNLWRSDRPLFIPGCSETVLENYSEKDQCIILQIFFRSNHCVKCPYSEFFWPAFFLHSDSIWRFARPASFIALHRELYRIKYANYKYYRIHLFNFH